MARKAGQIIGRDTSTWLVRVHMRAIPKQGPGITIENPGHPSPSPLQDRNVHQEPSFRSGSGEGELHTIPKNVIDSRGKRLSNNMSNSHILTVVDRLGAAGVVRYVPPFTASEH